MLAQRFAGKFLSGDNGNELLSQKGHLIQILLTGLHVASQRPCWLNFNRRILLTVIVLGINKVAVSLPSNVVSD